MILVSCKTKVFDRALNGHKQTPKPRSFFVFFLWMAGLPTLEGMDIPQKNILVLGVRSQLSAIGCPIFFARLALHSSIVTLSTFFSNTLKKPIVLRRRCVILRVINVSE